MPHKKKPNEKEAHAEDPAAAMPQEASEETEKLIDAGSELSFPASDPPSYMGGSAIIGPPPSTTHEPPREASITEVSDPAEVTPTKGDLPKGAVRTAEQADSAQSAKKAVDEHGDKARSRGKTPPDRPH